MATRKALVRKAKGRKRYPLKPKPAAKKAKGRSKFAAQAKSGRGKVGRAAKAPIRPAKKRRRK